MELHKNIIYYPLTFFIDSMFSQYIFICLCSCTEAIIFSLPLYNSSISFNIFPFFSFILLSFLNFHNLLSNTAKCNFSFVFSTYTSKMGFIFSPLVHLFLYELQKAKALSMRTNTHIFSHHCERK